MKARVTVCLKTEPESLTSDVVEYATRENYEDNVAEVVGGEWSNFTIQIDGDDIIIPREAISYIRFSRTTKVQSG